MPVASSNEEMEELIFNTMDNLPACGRVYLQYDIVQNQRHQRTAAVSRGSIKTVQHSGRFRIEDGCDEHFERHGCDHPQLYGCGDGIKQAVV